MQINIFRSRRRSNVRFVVLNLTAGFHEGRQSASQADCLILGAASLGNAETAEIIWTEGRHIGRSRTEELQQLFDIFQAHVDPRGEQ